MRIDDKDKKILEELKQNSRQSIRTIAKKTNIRPSTVHKRIQNLAKDGVIEKFTLKLNNKSVNENFIAIVLVKTKPGSLLDNKILEDHHVKEVFGVTGDYDLMLKLKFLDIEEFNEFLINFRKNVAIETTTTMIATINLKEEL